MAEPRDKPAPPHLMTVGQLAEHLQGAPSEIYRLLRNAHPPFLEIGGDYRFDRDEIDKWVAHRRVKD
jgi:excisionase family DNA binding protein